MSATGIVVSNDGDFQYTVAPDLAVAESVSGVSVIKETLTTGQQVKIIQIGNEENSDSGYGFCSIGADITGIVQVTEAIKQPMIQQSPANFAAAYIASKANKFARFFELGTITALYDSDITVTYLTGNSAGSSFTLPVLGVDPADFVIGEVALIDKRQYGTDTVVGWWEMILTKYWLEMGVFWSDWTVNFNSGFSAKIYVDGVEFVVSEYEPTAKKQYLPGVKNLSVSLAGTDSDIAGWEFVRWLEVIGGSITYTYDQTFSMDLNTDRKFLPEIKAKRLDLTGSIEITHPLSTLDWTYPTYSGGTLKGVYTWQGSYFEKGTATGHKATREVAVVGGGACRIGVVWYDAFAGVWQILFIAFKWPNQPYYPESKLPARSWELDTGSFFVDVTAPEEILIEAI